MANRCEYCHEDSDGGTKPLGRNAHVYLYPTMGNWSLIIRGGRKGIPKVLPIKYCPMCGRRLNNG